MLNVSLQNGLTSNSNFVRLSKSQTTELKLVKLSCKNEAK